MKKSILIFALMIVCFGVKAIAGNEGDCYIKTADKTYVGNDLKFGLSHTKIYFADGNFVKVKNSDIMAYRNHDKLYMLLPVVCNNTDTLCLAMMQYITSKSGGYVVFSYCCATGEFEDRLTNAKKNHFFVFKDGKYYRRIEEDQTEALAAFGIKVI
jgi:hypothetical protein